MDSGMKQVEHYGLQDPEVLAVAIELAPALFAALNISSRLRKLSYPLASDKDIEDALREAANTEERYEAPGVSIGASDSSERFPDGFLPVNDRLDLLRKTYMAIVIAHETEAKTNIEAARRGDLKVNASHPINVGDL